jgi:hypothetical protein
METTPSLNLVKDTPQLRDTLPTQTRSNQGGWQSTKYLSHEEYRIGMHRVHELGRAGFLLNVFCTITPPPEMSDSDAKRSIALKLARFGQSLERAGQPFVGMTAYEKPLGGNLHGHSLQFVMRRNFDRIERWADRFDGRRSNACDYSVEIHARLAAPSDIDYLLKEHRWGGPKIEGVCRKFYEPSEPIVGPRLSLTKYALAVIADREAKVVAPAQKPTMTAKNLVLEIEVAPPINSTDERGLFGGTLSIMLGAHPKRPARPRFKREDRHAGQAMLPFDMAPTVIDLAACLGPTHQAIAEKLGISRSQVSNIFVRRFGPGPKVARRIIELARAA